MCASFHCLCCQLCEQFYLQAFNSFAANKIHSFMCVCVCVRICVHLCMCRQGRKHCVLLIKAPPSLMSPRKCYTIGTCRLATLHSIFGPQSCRQTDTRARTHARSLSAVTEVGRFTFLCSVIYTAEPSNVQYP